MLLVRSIEYLVYCRNLTYAAGSTKFDILTKEGIQLESSNIFTRAMSKINPFVPGDTVIHSEKRILD